MPWCYQLPPNQHPSLLFTAKPDLLPGSFQSSAWGGTPAGHTGHQGLASQTTECFLSPEAWCPPALEEAGVPAPVPPALSPPVPCPARTPHRPVTSAGNSQPPCVTLPALNKALMNHNFLLFHSFRAQPLMDTSKPGSNCQRGFLLSVLVELQWRMLHTHK